MSKVQVTDVNISVGRIAWVVYLTGILFYCFAYLLRVYTGVLQPGLMHKLNITASGFGVMTSFYYFAYAPMQIPVGVCVDKIGPRRSLLSACFIATLGAYIFAKADILSLALMGRFLIGFGSAFAYVTALKLATLWLPRRYFASAAGAVTAMGMVAAIVTDNYLTHAMQYMSFSSEVRVPVLAGIVVFLLVLIFVRDRPKSKSREPQEPQESGRSKSTLTFAQMAGYLSQIIRNKQMWLIGVVGAFLYLPSSVFLDTWALPYLQVAHHLSAVDAAYAVSLMFVGWIVSGSLAGFISDTIKNRRQLLIASACFSLLFSCLLFYLPGLPKFAAYMLMLLIGLSCGPHHLCFTLSKENYTIRIAGTAIAFANLLIMMGGFIFQPVVGKLLDLMRGGLLLHGQPVYTNFDYQVALCIMPVGLFIALIAVFYIKDTYHLVEKDN